VCCCNVAAKKITNSEVRAWKSVNPDSYTMHVFQVQNSLTHSSDNRLYSGLELVSVTRASDVELTICIPGPAFFRPAFSVPHFEFSTAEFLVPPT